MSLNSVQFLFVPVGIGLVLAAIVDVFWTITPIGSPPGLIGNRLTGRIWQVVLTMHRRRPMHRLLAVLAWVW